MGAGTEAFAQDKGNWLISFCCFFFFPLNSILKSFSIDLSHRDKLDFYFLCRENKVIYLILYPSLSLELRMWGLFSLNASFLTDQHIKG